MSTADASFKSHQRYYISVLPSFKIKVHPQQCDRSILTINTSRYENNHKRLFAKKCFRLIPTTPAKEADYNLIQTHDLCMQLLPLEIQLLTFSPYLQSALICSLCDSHSNNTFTQTHIFLGEPSLRSCAGLGRPLRPTWFISRSHFHHLDRDFPKGTFQKPHKEEDFPEEMRKHSWYRSSCQRPQTQPQAAPIHRSLRYTCVCVCARSAVFQYYLDLSSLLFGMCWI